MKNLETMIGQPLAVSQLAGLYNYAALGGPLVNAIQPTLVFGPSGGGKSKLLSLFRADCEDKGVHTFQIDDCDTISLQSGANTADLIEALNASQIAPVLVIMDEAQKIFKGSKTKSAMERDLCTLIFPHGERVQDRIVTKIGGEEVIADFRNLILVLATNEKESMETSSSNRKGETPFARRFRLTEICTYSQGSMEQIIPAFFEANGFKIGECAAGMVGRLHRGTMSALCDVMKHVRENVIGKNTVSKADVVKACRLTDYLPRGLKKGEARLLDAASRNAIPSARGQVISGHFGKLYQASLNHLLEQWTEKKGGERIASPLISVLGSKIVTTPFGEKFLASIAKDGFTW
jgi:hypothetical protein